MSIVSNTKEFVEAYTVGANITLGSDITITESLAAGDVTVNGNGHTLKLTKPLNLGGNTRFIQTVVDITADDIGAIYTNMGGTVEFEDCTVKSSGVLIGMLSGDENIIVAAFKNCDITAADSLFKVKESTEEEQLGRHIERGSYRYVNTTVDRSAVSFTNCNVTCNTTGAVLDLENFAYPMILGLGNSTNADKQTISIPSAKSILTIGAPGHSVILSNMTIPTTMDGSGDNAIVKFAEGACDSVVDNSRVTLVGMKFPDSMVVKNYVLATDIAPNGTPNGYTVWLEDKAIRKHIRFDIQAKGTNQKYLEKMRGLLGEIHFTPSVEDAAKNESLLVFNTKNLHIDGALECNELFIVKSYVEINGAITAEAAFSVDALSLVEGSGSVTADGNTIKLPINAGIDSRDPQGPMLAATGSAGDGPITNKMVQAIIDKFGNRLFLVRFDNGMGVDIGYQRSAAQTVNDIILENIGGVDMFGVRTHMVNPALRRHTRETTGASYVTWHVTACIQAFAVMDEGFEMHRPDAMVVI